MLGMAFLTFNLDPSFVSRWSPAGRDHAAGEQVFIDYDGGVGLRLAWEMVHTYGSLHYSILSQSHRLLAKFLCVPVLPWRKAVAKHSCQSCGGSFVTASLVEGFVPNNLPAYAGRHLGVAQLSIGT